MVSHTAKTGKHEKQKFRAEEHEKTILLKLQQYNIDAHNIRTLTPMSRGGDKGVGRGPDPL
jgi:hypothetical protein